MNEGTQSSAGAAGARKRDSRESSASGRWRGSFRERWGMKPEGARWLHRPLDRTGLRARPHVRAPQILRARGSSTAGAMRGPRMNARSTGAPPLVPIVGPHAAPQFRDRALPPSVASATAAEASLRAHLATQGTRGSIQPLPRVREAEGGVMLWFFFAAGTGDGRRETGHRRRRGVCGAGFVSVRQCRWWNDWRDGWIDVAGWRCGSGSHEK